MPAGSATAPSGAQRLYFANHTSHIDTLAIWSALPRELRARTRPIAANDYWGQGLRRYIATRGFGAVLIDRARENATTDPLEPLRAALRAGDSLILFPEGTRGTSEVPARFKSGLHRLALEFRASNSCPYISTTCTARCRRARCCRCRWSAPCALARRWRGSPMRRATHSSHGRERR